jgi:hypothetical protein
MSVLKAHTAVYCLFFGYLFILGGQNVFLAVWTEITNQPKSKQITLCTTSFYKLPGLHLRSQI